MYDLIFQLLGIVYASVLRGLLIKAIDDPDEVWDDHVLLMCDTLFGFKDK